MEAMEPYVYRHVRNDRFYVSVVKKKRRASLKTPAHLRLRESPRINVRDE